MHLLPKYTPAISTPTASFSEQGINAVTITECPNPGLGLLVLLGGLVTVVKQQTAHLEHST